MTELGLIEWTEQNELFGLDYSNAIGIFKDWKFDIRYDCDFLEPSKKPTLETPIWLNIHFKEVLIDSISGSSIDKLKRRAEQYLIENK